MRRNLRLAGSLAVAAAAAALGIAHAGPAVAGPTEATYNVPSTGGSKTYGGIPISGTAQLTVGDAVADPTPADCASAAYCRIVPIEVAYPPGNTDHGDYTIGIKFEVSWPDAGGDIDVYAYTVGKDPDDPASTDSTTTEVGSSAGGTNPEVLTHGKVKSELLVFNYQGIISSFTVKVTPKFEVLTKQTEKPDDSISGGFGTGPTPTATFPSTTTTTPLDVVTTPASTDTTVAADTSVTGGPSSPIAVSGSSDAIDLSGAARTSDNVFALGGGQEDTPKVAGPASTSSVLGVLVGVPLGALALGFGIVKTRSSGRVKIPDLPPTGEVGVPGAGG